MCRLLDVSPEMQDDQLLEAMESASYSLREAEKLRYRVLQQQGPPKCETINKIYCHENKSENLYLDEPWVVESGRFNAHLRGSQAVPHLELHLERNKEITFIVYRDFECCNGPPPKDFNYHGRVTSYLDSNTANFLKAEYISLVSEELSEHLKKMAKVTMEGIPHPEFSRRTDEKISYPYVWWFHRRYEIKSFIESLHQTESKHLAVFQQYVLGRLDGDWSMAQSLLDKGRITAEYMPYLFVPNEILIEKADSPKQGQIRGVLATNWLQTLTASEKDFRAIIQVSAWGFRGSFHRTVKIISITGLPKCSQDGSFLITDLLSVYPIRYASAETIQALQQRGRMFWKCRYRNYVTSRGFSGDGLQNSVQYYLYFSLTADSRFMVDYRTYKQMHPGGQSVDDDDLGLEIMRKDNPGLGDRFLMCLPVTIPGFNMQKKEWVELDVGLIDDVKWNDEAFEHLVIDADTKELVQAVVTTRLRAEENTDLIRGKGNGLFILLHGVAEIARKPLYRVTCGDIGTKAEEVEQYLDTVLVLGKTWGCVVLLDEADVFLEERTLQSLERNALVSVFLRVLEYYDGILILTSNRVGTFDEAFKSRIQLNLRYQNLNEQQRIQIWSNFIDRIDKLDKGKAAALGNSKSNNGLQLDFGVNAEEIRQRLHDLAKANLNGREIRNAISTARQLAAYRRKPLGYEHISRAIDEASKFDEYSNELRRGLTADDILRERGER
ncbi:hypothetical protein GCG54_00009079 [Colletotrichum gloeosporioides]|uniref:ATPase AAA-type core domain-containing protein n=1 Tax=Colletotrichum gloeosporioides TaxID=474922 RepID=A0A8H8WNJ3_COLGL|nr:uncharacterized protein GCG54_00009079 [Colletotrichum gloeosporioides]KAF3797109.1 hypothetical protein GCG54_00009079 [Colletotrichum gloeosporioides]